MAPQQAPLERRSVDRPRSGAARPCPFCRAGSLIFDEAYRPSAGQGVAPAWLCENPTCEYRQFARTETAQRMAETAAKKR